MILFSAEWCPHCKRVKKFLEANPQYEVSICDVDKDFDTPKLYGVKQIPALATNNDKYEVMVESSDIIQFIEENA